MSYATAADLPPELFDNVIENFSVQSHWEIVGKVLVDKRQLGAISLTCRRWAQRCRTYMFHRIALRVHSDVGELILLMDAPNQIEPVIRDCLTFVDVKQEGAWTIPWFYRILPFEVHLMMHGTYVLDSSKPEGKRFAPRSFSTGLPSTLPNSIFSEVRSVTLEDMIFERFGDLVHLLCGLRILRNLTLSRVTFEDTRMEANTGHPRRRFPQLISLSLTEFEDPSHHMAMIVTMVRLASAFPLNLKRFGLRAPRNLLSDDWAILERILLAFLPSGRQGPHYFLDCSPSGL